MQGAYQSYSNYGNWNNTTSYVGSNGGYWTSGAAGGTDWTNTTSEGSSRRPNAYLGLCSATILSGNALQLYGDLYMPNYTDVIRMWGYAYYPHQATVVTAVNANTVWNPQAMSDIVTSVYVTYGTIYYLGR